MKIKPHGFKLAPLTAGILIAFSPLNGQALTYNSGLLDFTYYGGNLWGPNSDYTFSKSAFAGTSFGTTNIPTIGYIHHTGITVPYAGTIDTSTGAEMKTTISPGRVGFDVSTQINPGKINIDYGFDASLALPDNILAGSLYSFTGSSKTLAGHTSMSTQFSSLSYTESLDINIPSSTKIEGCIAGQCGSKTFNTGVSMAPFDLASYNRNGDGNIVVNNITQTANFGKTYDVVVGPDPVLSGTANVGMTLGSITPYTPVVDTSTASADSQGSLHSASSSSILNTTVDLAPLGYGSLAALGLPTPNLQLTLAGVVSASGTLYDLNSSATFNLAQDFKFDPNLMVSLSFDHPITAVERLFNGDSYDSTSNTFTVSMNALKDIQFIFDKNTTVTPTFILDNSFTNKTDLNINGSLDFGVLKGSLDLINQHIAGFDGFNWNLANGNLGDINIFDQTYSLDFKSLLGKAFDVTVQGPPVASHIAIWTGQDPTSDTWSKSPNWQDSNAPINGDAIVFDSSSSGNNASVNDAITTVNGITFLHGFTDFLLRGNSLINTGAITNQSSIIQTINLNIALGSHQIWDGGKSGLLFTGQLDLAGYDLALSNVKVLNHQNVLVGSNKSEGLTLDTGSLFTVDGLTIGQATHGNGKVYVDGAATSAQIARDLTVADGGSGYLFVENGGHISSTNATVGMQQNANAYIAIDGAGSALSAQNLMFLGQDGLVNLKLTQGGALGSNDAQVATKATADVTMSVQDSASQWTVDHKLDMTGAGRTRLDITNGGALVVGANGQSGVFQLGGSSTNRTEIGVNTSGSITVNGDMQINQNATIHLTGSAASTPPLKVSGVTNLNSGANLSLNDAAAAFDKGLKINGNLTSTGDSQVNGAVTLNQSSGAIEAKSGLLAFSDDVTFNSGNIKTDSGATTEFLGNLHGTGNFSGPGTVDIEGSYAPGNSAAQIDFGGGNLQFGLTSILDINISGNQAGTQYDQLKHINLLSFNGELVLNFATYSPTADTLFHLFDFTSFAGSFDLSKILVTGFDKNRLDFSQLAINGNVDVKAVPLPAGVWLFGSGILAMAGLRRKNGAKVTA
jgi:T5SS/PEP-CTERM-associated repeat protein